MFAAFTLKEWFGLLSVVISMSNLLLYMRTIIVGKTKPHAFSWLLWSIVMGTVFAAQRIDGAGAGSWQTGVGGFLCGVIGVLALFRGEKKITRSDWVALCAAISAIPLWAATANPLAAVVILTCTDGLGFYPTFRKSYHAPYQENVSWTFRATFAFLFSILALEHYNPTTLLYPLVMVVLHFALGIMLLWRRRGVEG